VKELKAKVQRHKAHPSRLRRTPLKGRINRRAHPSRLTPYSPEGENKSQGTSLPANAVLP